MDIDFSLVLTLAVLITGALWAFDALLLRPGRRRRLDKARSEARLQGSALPAATEEQIMRESGLFEMAHSFFPVLAIVWVLRSFLAEPFTIPSGSMLPSLQVGDYVLVNKFAYGLRLPVLGTELLPVGKPERGDVMVFKVPLDEKTNYIKRVIGLPGDRIESRGEVLFINGVEARRVLVSQEPAVAPWEQVWQEQLGQRPHTTREEIDNNPAGSDWALTVPAGHYFMMGDNRDNSKDSRFWCYDHVGITGCATSPGDSGQHLWGFMPERLIVGKAFYIWMHKKPGLNWPSFSRNGAIE